MDTRPDQPAEGKLIEEARKRAGLSIRKASDLAGLSYGRWRQITSGFQNVSPGSWAEVRGPAETVARMAGVVCLTAADMEDAGRLDVAEVMRDRTWEPPVQRSTDQAIEAIRNLPGAPPAMRRALEALARGMREIEEAESGDGNG